MRWLIIIWLLLSGVFNFSAVSLMVSYTHKNLSMLENVREAFSQKEYIGRKAQALEQLNHAIDNHHSTLFSPFVKISYIIMVIFGLIALFSAILLAAKKELGIKLGLIYLVLMLAWGLYASFSKESFRNKIDSEYRTIYKSVSELSEKEVEYSPELKEAVKPKLTASICHNGIDFLFLLLLFLRRKTIIIKHDIQQPLSVCRPPAAGLG